MTNTIDRYAFESAVENITEEDSVRADYPGRGMFGSVCIGIVVSPRDVYQVSGELVRAAAELREMIESDRDGLEWDAEEATADALEGMVRSISVDNMGMDMIVYFPGWEFSD